jgi:hypothetical protein
MTQREENEIYIHFVICIQNLNGAWVILQQIKEGKGESGSPVLVAAAFRFALIEYAKPYLRSRGTEVRNHLLNERFIPSQHIALHRRLVSARNQIHAHSDLTVLDAKLYVEKAQNEKIVLASQNIIHGTEELSNLEVIVELIEQTLANMYLERNRLEQQLPFTS